MKNLRIFFLIFLLLFFFFSPAKSFASNEFKTYCQVTYRLFDNGNATLSQEISIVNLQADLYVSEYLIKIPDKAVQNVQAWDRIGPLKISQSQKNDGIEIKLSFNEKVVGKDQNLSFILKYDVSNFAKKIGRLWRLDLPKLESTNLPDNYKIILKIPNSFGQLAFSSPFPNKSEDDLSQENLTVYSFSNPELFTNGAVLLFGDYQVFDFKINYHLSNPKKNPVSQFITIPPDTEYQTVTYTSISPNPIDVIKDVDGNWLAKFNLNPNEKMDIVAIGKAKLFSSPANKDFVIFNQSPTLEKYLEPSKYWDVDSLEIKNIVKNIKTPQEIYNFVQKTLTYDYERVSSDLKRLGSLEALNQPQKSLCTEFTDLFIALARAAKIPAREIEGFAYTDNPKLRPLSTNNDILHAWPEYYDFETKTWKMIDPTWGKTTGGFDYFKNFDMSHFAFVTHGVDSQYPLSPGSFKLEGNNTKDIFVELGQDQAFVKNLIKVNLSFSKKNIFANEITGKLLIENFGPKASYMLPVKVLEANSLPITLESNLISEILPFGKIEMSVRIKSSFNDLFKTKSLSVTLLIGEEKYLQNLIFGPIIPKILIGIFLLVIIFVVFFFLIKKRFYPKKLNEINPP